MSPSACRPSPALTGVPHSVAYNVCGGVLSHPEAAAAMLMVLAPHSHRIPIAYLVMNSEGEERHY